MHEWGFKMFRMRPVTAGRYKVGLSVALSAFLHTK